MTMGRPEQLERPEEQLQQKPLDIGLIFRNHFRQEKQAYNLWMESLTPEEMRRYETMGFQFQLLRAVCQNPELIALSADESEGERFSFREVVVIARDLQKMAAEFLGPELNRKPNPVTEQFATAYNILRVFLAQQKLYEHTEEQETHTLSYSAYFDQDLLSTLEKVMPADVVTLIKAGESPNGSNGRIERDDVANAFTRMVRALQLTDGEKEQFKQAMKVIIRIRQRVHQNQAEGSMKKQLGIADLEEMVQALGRIECLRRVYPSGAGTMGSQTEKMHGLSEIHRLVKFIASWEETFRWLGKMKLGKMFKDEETPEQKEARMDEEREKRRVTIKNFMDSFNLIFPDPVAPMIVKRHREVLKRGVQHYAVLAAAVNAIEDEKTKSDLKRVLFQMSTILSYLEYMWNMHEVQENESGKHIVYPKKMLLLGPLIIQETENLAATLNFLSEQYRGAFGAQTDELDDLFDTEKKPTGLAVNYEDSAMFKLGPEMIVRETHDTAVTASGTASEEDRQRLEAREKMADTLGMVSYMLSVNISTARRNLKATRVKTVMTNEEKPEAAGEAVQTLSYDIHDFINDLQDTFQVVLYELARVFNESLTKKEVLPEIAAQEEQAARLRSQIYALGTKIKPSGEVMQFAMTANPHEMEDDIVPGLQAMIQNLAVDIAEFQSYQERNLNAKKYHEVLRGAGYEKLLRLSNAVADFSEHYAADLDAKTVDMYVLRKRLDEFAEKAQTAMSLGELSRNGILGAWLKDLELLKKVEDRILANGLKPAEMKELQEKYMERFMHVLNILCAICTQEEVIHSIPDGDEKDIVTYRVPDDVKKRFTAFIERNPLVETCETSRFTTCFHKFYKLMHLMSDVTQVCDLQMNVNTPEQEFLKGYDMEKANVLNEELTTLLAADYTATDRAQRNRLLLSLARCREALGHLIFRSPEQAKHLDMFLADMENAIRVRYEQEKTIHPDDLEDFYFQFIREYIQNPIVIH